MPFFEKRLEESGSGFILPSGISYIDFSLGHFIGMLNTLEKDLMSTKHSKLVEYTNNLHSLPQLKEYLSKRKN